MENLDDGVGRVLITGVPERYQPNESYPVTVTVTRPGVAVAGFQLTARFEGAGTQAGALTFPEDGVARGRVALREGVQYAQHLRPGTSLVAPDTARWTVLWTAPREGGSVLLHVAANAADDDDSVYGDFIYTAVSASQGSP
jgi:hypothetical protein